MAAALVTLNRSGAAAPDPTKQACAEAFESAQQLRGKSRLVAAREALRTCSQPACPAVVRGPCSQWLPEVEGSLSTVVVEVRDEADKPLSGATITVDGAAPVREENGHLALDPGTHTLRAERPGKAPIEQTVKLVGGEKAMVVTLRAPPPPASPPPTAEPARPTQAAASGGVPALAYVLGGVGLVGLGAFGYFGLSGRADQDQLEKSCSPSCAPSQADPVRRKYIIADVSLGVGLVALGAAAWVALSPRPAPTTARLGLGVGPGSAALLIGGSLQ